MTFRNLGIRGATLVVALTATVEGTGSAQVYTFTDLAGGPGGRGWFDGVGSGARFNRPGGVAVSPAGDVFVADSGNNTLRTVTPAGLVRTLAGTYGFVGEDDATGAWAAFRFPGGLAADPVGNLYVADRTNCTIRKVTPGGVVTTLAGLAQSCGSADGTGTAARFYNPSDVVVDSAGNVFVADSGNHSIRKVTPDGVVTTVAGLAGSSGSADGTGTAARFWFPRGVAVAPSGDVFVGDSGNRTIRKVTPEGVVSTVAGLAGVAGSADGSGSEARFGSPGALARDPSGSLWIADGNRTVRVLSASGAVTTAAGLAGNEGSTDGPASLARFSFPEDIGVGGSGEVYIADSGGGTVRVLAGGSVSTLAGLGAAPGNADGGGPGARFSSPTGVATESSGSVLVADGGNHVIRRVTTQGDVTTVAGLAGVSGSTDGTGTEARFDVPTGVALDAAGNAYVTDRDNHVVRRITPQGDVTTVAGLAGSPGSVDGTGTTARFFAPTGVAVGAAGGVYVADSGNHAIRLVDSAGTVRTVVGLPGTFGFADGFGTTARFRNPTGLAVDGAGNLLVADTDNGRVRRVTPDGYVGTLSWGSGGFLSAFRGPSGLAVDASGGTFVTETGRIRRFEASGSVTTSAGSTASLGHVEGTEWNARFFYPSGVAASPSGDIYVADRDNHAIRKGSPGLPDQATVDEPDGRVGDPRRLGSSPPTATAWRWRQVRIEAGSTATLSATDVADPEFTPDVPGVYAFQLTASDGVKSSITIVSLAAWDEAGATVSGGGRICEGQDAVVRADLTGAPPWRITWSDGVVQWAGTSPFLRSVRPSSTTTYSITSLSDALGSGTSTGEAIVVVDLLPPAPVVSAPALPAPDTAGFEASVPDAGPGATYLWTISNGTLVSGQGTRTVTFATAGRGICALEVTVTTSAGCGLTGRALLRVGEDPTPPVTIRHFAGSDGGPGWRDGARTTARFSVPNALAIDLVGNLYVTDSGNHTVRVVTPAGEVRTVAGLAEASGSADGTGSHARFDDLSGIAVTASGILYVTDGGSVVRISPGGVVSTLDDPPWDGRLSGIAVDAFGCLYVSSANHTIRKVSPSGEVTTVAGQSLSPGSSDGVGTAARFNDPQGLVVDAAGNLIVADSWNGTIRVISRDGTVSTLAGLAGARGDADGTGTEARFQSPRGVTIGAGGEVIVSDGGRSLRGVTRAGVVRTIAGRAGEYGSADGAGTSARFSGASGLATGPSGEIYVADEYNHAVRRVTYDGAVTTWAGRPAREGSADGTGPEASFRDLAGVAVDGCGTVFIADTGNHIIRKADPGGSVTTLAGLAGAPGSSDGTGSAARFTGPEGIAAGPCGHVIVADTYSHTIRKISPGGVVTTLAGLAGTYGSDDGLGTAARFNRPSGLAVDGFGNVYVADRFGGAIRVVSEAGAVRKLVPATSPTAVGLDAAGNVYFSECGSSASRIRKVTPDGVVSTVAGDLAGSADGTGSAGRFHCPTGLGVDGSGNVWVADRENHALRLVTPGGVVTTVAGSLGEPGRDDGTGSASRFSSPASLTLGFGGELYVADKGNDAIRRGTSSLQNIPVVDRPSGRVGEPRQLDTLPRTATAWLWEPLTIPAGSTASLSSSTVPAPTFVPDAPGYYLFQLTARDGTRESLGVVGMEAWVPPTAELSGGGRICAGTPVELKVVLTGVAPWTLKWSDGVTQGSSSTNPRYRLVFPRYTTAYSVAEVADANATGTSSGGAVVIVNPGPVPAAPTILVPGSVQEGTVVTASVEAHEGSVYAWTISSGTIDTGQGTSRITFPASTPGSLTIGVVETSSSGCSSPISKREIVVVEPPVATSFYTLPPCRLLDTRDPDGPWGGPAVRAYETRFWELVSMFGSVGRCGIPMNAKALALNVTPIASAPGAFTLASGDVPLPLHPTVILTPGAVRAFQMTPRVGRRTLMEPLALKGWNASGSPLHVVVDVFGYWK